MATYFISYNSADAEIAEKVATALEDVGQRVRYAGWEVVIGTNIAIWMNEALEDCDRLVAIVSPDYLKPGAKYSAAERVAVLWTDIDGRKAAVIPLVVRPAEMPKLFGAIRRYDLADGTMDRFVAEVLRQPRPPGVEGVSPGEPKRHTQFVNIPPGRAVIGRNEEVAELREKLMASSGGSVSLVNSGVVLRGQGGLGKSTLARRYAEVHGGAYDGAIWVEAQTRQAIIEGLVALCGHFDLDVPDTPQLQHAQAALARIAQSGQSWLFIYDNVETYADLKDLLPPPGAHLIVTTRQGEGWPGFDVMPLDRLSFESEDASAVNLLMLEAGRTDGADEARALAEDLGGLPLALVVAGALIRSTGESFSAYRERLSEILSHTPDNEDYPTSVLGAVQMSYKYLPEDAKLVADLCAWWAAEGLEPALLTDAPDGWDWEDRAEDISEAIQFLARDGARVRAAFAALTGRSLLESGEGAWSMHRMTAAALRHLQQDREDGAMAKAAAALLAAVYPSDPNVSATWSACARLTPHVRALWVSGAAPETEAMDYLFNQAAVYLGKIADFFGNLEMARASFALTEKRLPEAHVEIALGLATLGLALMRAGELGQAEEHLARALELDEAHRPETVNLANRYDQHGAVLSRLAQAGDATALPRSLKRHQQALALFRQQSGRTSDGTAQALNNLAGVRDLQGRTAAAARLSQAALVIRREVLDPGDARLGYSLVNTGSYWLQSGSANRAEALLREALELRRTVFAAQPQHPETRNAASWLISCLLVLARAGDDPDARQAGARALCAQYSFDFAEREESARQYPLAPPVD
ncbi:toll/interleukin-1 receptor domain-containing protein [uncultured Hoeflea sp.]|uniref:tetratricopeptide repeat protein n=1 Tax=uncultured Hoeflea sp. TaxID=538666 RepID=UPI00263887BF|nr:toll/interleukin-1 receptor domain-containing protein [uncultured Hoeflea sp.]